MAYATQADLEAQLSLDELIQLTDDDGTGVIDAARVARAIADADEEIDGYLQARLSVPIAPVPGIIRKVSVDLAIYNLYSRRGDAMPDTRRERYEAAVKFLTKVAEGKIGLGANDPAGNPPDVGSVGVTLGGDRTMTRDKLDRY